MVRASVMQAITNEEGWALKDVGVYSQSERQMRKIETEKFKFPALQESRQEYYATSEKSSRHQCKLERTLLIKKYVRAKLELSIGNNHWGDYNEMPVFHGIT